MKAPRHWAQTQVSVLLLVLLELPCGPPLSGWWLVVLGSPLSRLLW
jgi:hypothetical protein